MARYVISCKYRHPRLGIVHVAVRDSRTIRAYWSKGEMHITVPRDTDVDTYNTSIEKFCDKLLSMRPQDMYYDGWHYAFELGSITLRHTLDKKGLNYTYQVEKDAEGLSHYTIDMHRNIDLTQPKAQQAVSLIVQRIALKFSEILMSEAVAESERLGVHPAMWDVSRGLRILGHCNARGVIALSSVLVFLPRHLRRLLITHELSHLREMNHSSRFYAVWRTYYGDGFDEAQRQFKAFCWPVLR